MRRRFEPGLSLLVSVHSLAAAVADGTISDEAARGGLYRADLQALFDRHPFAKVLVGFRSHVADGRMVCRIGDLVAWAQSNAEMIADGRAWSLLDIRDVLAHVI